VLVAFPLLIIPLAIYNMIAFLTPPDGGWLFPLATVHLVSGKDWMITLGDAVIGLTLVLLLFEIVKAVRPGAMSVIDHMLSVLVFIAAVGEFVMVGQAATSTFAVLCAICLVDAIGGIAISVRVGRRVVASGDIASSHASQQLAEPSESPHPVEPPAPTHPTEPPLPPQPVRPAFSPAPDIAQPGTAASHPTP
jgi:hypothetical protein